MSMIEAATVVLGHTDFVVIGPDQVALNAFLPADPEDNNGLPRREFVTAEQLSSILVLATEMEGEVPVPESVSARQFKLQLLASGLIDQVEAWVAAQDRATQIAYEYSGSFVRGEPMMQAGFDALGFTAEQGDAFFTAAALL